jgi:hypothetical protein
VFVCCEIEVSANSWSLVQRSPTDCGASLCVIKKPRGREGHSPRWAAEPEFKKLCYVEFCLNAVSSLLSSPYLVQKWESIVLKKQQCLTRKWFHSLDGKMIHIQRRRTLTDRKY